MKLTISTQLRIAGRPPSFSGLEFPAEQWLGKDNDGWQSLMIHVYNPSHLLVAYPLCLSTINTINCYWWWLMMDIDGPSCEMMFDNNYERSITLNDGWYVSMLVENGFGQLIMDHDGWWMFMMVFGGWYWIMMVDIFIIVGAGEPRW